MSIHDRRFRLKKNDLPYSSATIDENVPKTTRKDEKDDNRRKRSNFCEPTLYAGFIRCSQLGLAYLPTYLSKKRRSNIHLFSPHIRILHSRVRFRRNLSIFIGWSRPSGIGCFCVRCGASEGIGCMKRRAFASVAGHHRRASDA